MTESEKMAQGEWYFATDKQLVAQRLKAKAACFTFNHISPDNISERKRVLKTLLPNAPSAWIEPHFYCDYGFNIYARGALFANHNVSILDGAEVRFGSNIFIGPGVVIAATSHPKEPEKRARGLCRSLPISIGNDVWIGANATILGGAVIADGSIISANSLIK